MRKSITLKQMEMAYLEQELLQDESLDTETCGICWRKGCSCNSTTIETELYVNDTKLHLV